MDISHEDTDRYCKEIAELIYPVISKSGNLEIVSLNRDKFEIQLKQLVAGIKMEIIHDIRSVL